MKKNQKTQSGFGIIESLLLIIAIAIVVFVCYYVWHTQKQTDKTLYTATATSQQTASIKPVQKFFTIKEWGVRAPYSGSLHLEYKIASQNGYTYAYISSLELDKSDSRCVLSPSSGGSGGYGGLISRYSPGQHLEGPVGPTDQTIEQAISSGADTVYSHVGNFYYDYQIDPNSCSPNQTSQSLEKQTQAAVSALVPKLQEIN